MAESTEFTSLWADSATDIDDTRSLVERQSDLIPLVDGPDEDPGWVQGNEFHLVLVPES